MDRVHRQEVRARLARMHLLKPSLEQEPAAGNEDRDAPVPSATEELLRLCDAAALEGGLSIAAGVRPDELIGPLTAAIGGSARGLKILEVRDSPTSITVQLGNERHELKVDGLRALARRFNDLLAKDDSARAIAVLGEHQDALQLWCVDKRSLPHLLQESFFRPENRRDLSRLSVKAGVR